MRKTTLLNSYVSTVISEMGHTDTLTIADAGLPIRGEAERIDLALKLGVPGFLEVLDTVLSELCVQKITLAEEILTASPQMDAEIRKRFGEEIQVEYVPHETFKKMSESTKAVVRTGECTPYSNIILEAGVTF